MFLDVYVLIQFFYNICIDKTLYLRYPLNPLLQIVDYDLYLVEDNKIL